jgi:hypothetical protein
MLEYRDGKLEKKVELPYSYDTAKGALTMTGAGGGPPDSYIVMERVGEADHLYVRPMYDTVYTYTVYTRVGYAGKPPSDVAGARPIK